MQRVNRRCAGHVQRKNVLSVSHTFRFRLARFLSITRTVVSVTMAGNYKNRVKRKRVRSIGHQRMRTDKYRTRNARVPNKTHAQWSPFQVLCMHKTFAGLNGPRLTRNAFAERETDKKRMRTETNGLKILLSVGRPLTLSGKV